MLCRIVGNYFVFRCQNKKRNRQGENLLKKAASLGEADAVRWLLLLYLGRYGNKRTIGNKHTHLNHFMSMEKFQDFYIEHFKCISSNEKIQFMLGLTFKVVEFENPYEERMLNGKSNKRRRIKQKMILKIVDNDFKRDCIKRVELVRSYLFSKFKLLLVVFFY